MTTRPDPFARVTFVPEDIDAEAQQAREWLDRNRKYIEEAMLKAGWDAIDTRNNLDPIIPQTGERT